jgi:hypothetical protein
MSSYWRDCKFCGQKIIMALNDRGWQPLEPDHSGRHVCGSGADYGYRSSGYATATAVQSGTAAPPSPPRSWRLEALDHPFTRRIKCWWCGESVFFHTNGNADCVLLDGLGWPWPVHG